APVADAGDAVALDGDVAVFVVDVGLVRLDGERVGDGAENAASKNLHDSGISSSFSSGRISFSNTADAAPTGIGSGGVTASRAGISASEVCVTASMKVC